MDRETLRAVQGRMVGAATEDRTKPRNTRRAKYRWLVHIGLLVSFVAAFGTLQLLHVSNAIHAGVGLVFAGLVIVHLAQRRHRLARMLAQLMRLRPRVKREMRLLGSDAIFTLSRSTSWCQGSSTWGGEPPSTSGTSSLQPCSSCTWSCTSRAGGDISDVL